MAPIGNLGEEEIISPSVTVSFRAPLTSKSRPVPIVSRRCIDNEYRYQTELFNDPGDDLLEARLAAAARSRIKRVDGPWETARGYAVTINVGVVTGGKNVDLDNIAKLVLDGLTGVVWDSDTRVEHLTITRKPDAAKRTSTTIKVEPM